MKLLQPLHSILATSSLLIHFVQAKQPSAPSATPAPLRNLTWGQLNFLHTTDTHGWHAGHLSEASYSADWGDYISFSEHMRRLAHDKGVDLLVLDSGDRIEGNGLYDASTPKGKYTLEIVPRQHIDVLCSGNHELYKNESALGELTKTVPSFAGNYLASNLDIWNDDAQAYEALAPRFKKFTTPNLGIRILAFGFIFNFQRNSNISRVQFVEQTVEERWFQKAIRDTDIDLILVVGHVAIRDSPEMQTIFSAIRAVKWDTPIQFFGGHTHIRDFVRYDKKSTALESGRYMETIGWLSIDGLDIKNKTTSNSNSLTFSRSYIDNNLYSYTHHSGVNESSFSTESGRNATDFIAMARSELNLDHAFGCVPKTLWEGRVEADNESSIYHWLAHDVFSSLHEQESKEEQKRPKLVIANAGAIRFDLYKGPYTIDSQYLVSPFTSGFGIVRDVDYSAAKRVVEILNKNSFISLPDSIGRRPHREISFASSNQEQAPLGQVLSVEQDFRKNEDEVKLSPGYVTTDDDGNEGDDTEHALIPTAKIPAVIQGKVNFPTSSSAAASTATSTTSASQYSASWLPQEAKRRTHGGIGAADIEARVWELQDLREVAADTEPEKVDIAYNEFIEPKVLDALRSLGQNFTQKDTGKYLDGKSMTAVISDWVSAHWPCPKSSS